MSDIPKGDPTLGAKIFKQRCAQCHTTEKVICKANLQKHHPLKIANLKFCTLDDPI